MIIELILKLEKNLNSNLNYKDEVRSIGKLRWQTHRRHSLRAKPSSDCISDGGGKIGPSDPPKPPSKSFPFCSGEKSENPPLYIGGGDGVSGTVWVENTSSTSPATKDWLAKIGGEGESPAESLTESASKLENDSNRCEARRGS